MGTDGYSTVDYSLILIFSNFIVYPHKSYTYLSKYCKFELDWVTFHDDDVFIDHLRLEKILQRQSPSIKSKFLCPFRVATAKLQSTDKFTFPENLWDPEITNFPAYCAGPCTTMSGKSAEKIFNTAKITNWRGFFYKFYIFALKSIKIKKYFRIRHRRRTIHWHHTA